MVFVRVTGRAIVNVHSANAEGAVGNYIGLSKMFVVRRRRDGGYDLSEEPVVSGNMLKHWHAVRMVELLKEWNGTLCETCKRFVMYRSSLPYSDEFEFVKACAIEDVHGFLQPDTTVRRESLVKFSFLIPVEELGAQSGAVTHNRVYLEPTGAIPAEEQLMMVFRREYASGVYGFMASMDLKYVGRALADPDNAKKVLPLEERKKRARAAMLALADILTGRFGASSARALPVLNTVELIVAVSRKPMTNLLSGFYYDYVEESAKAIKALLDKKVLGPDDLRVFVCGKRVAEKFNATLGNVVTVCDSPVSAVLEAAAVVESWLT